MKISPEIEFRTPAEIKLYQEERLRKAIHYVAEKSPFYKLLFAENDICADEIRTIEDLQRLPFTTKRDLQLCNRDFLCVPETEIVDYITTSGTLGDPVTFACTSGDLDRLAYNEAMSFECAGVTSNSRVQLMVTLDKRFMAGLAYFLGLRKLGAGAIRVGNGIPELQWDTISRLKPDTVMCVPSFIPKLIEYAESHNIDYRKSSVRRIIGIGESVRTQDFELNELGQKIMEKWDVKLYATYSSTEMGATFPECEFGCGGHHHPDLLVVEIIGEDNNPVPDGEVGEVVITSLGVEGMPLVRFRTGDMACIHTEKCRCGRQTFRISPIVGRKDNMIKLKGTTLYPPAVFNVLNQIDYIENYQMIVTAGNSGTDDVTVHVGLRYKPDFDVVKDVKDHFRARIRVAPNVEVHATDDIRRATMPAMSRKPILFVDKRPK